MSSSVMANMFLLGSKRVMSGIECTYEKFTEIRKTIDEIF